MSHGRSPLVGRFDSLNSKKARKSEQERLSKARAKESDFVGAFDTQGVHDGIASEKFVRKRANLVGER